MNPAVFAGVIALLLAGRARRQTHSPVTSGALTAILVWIFVGPLWLIELVELARAIEQRDGSEFAISLALVAITTLVLFPWLITRALLIPTGRAKLAWFVTRMSFWTWRGDVRGGAVIAAVLALMRRSEIDPGLVGWVEAKRDGAAPSQNPVRWKAGGAAIVATGLLAALRDDRRGARRLLASAAELVAESWPRRALRLASEWLCADAIERGDWREVEFVARTAPVDSPTLRLLAALAARLTGIAPVPNDLIVRLRWWQAPRRRAMRPLVEAALAMPMTPRPRERRGGAPLEPSVAAASSGPLGLALDLHVALLRLPTDQLHAVQLVQVGDSWDRALASDALDRQLRERGLALGCKSDQALRTLIDEVEADLAELIRSGRVPLASLGEVEGLLARVVRRLHGELLDALEVASEAFEARVDARRSLPAMDEWQSFLALREQHAEAVALGGPELRRLAFNQLHGPVCGLAVWLWNERSERALGNAIFQWLLSEAIVVDDAEAIRLQEKNVGCGI
ncbi:hypothetical protein ACNOYE_22450 [Nannocystaceae bacterium ST9]